MALLLTDVAKVSCDVSDRINQGFSTRDIHF